MSAILAFLSTSLGRTVGIGLAAFLAGSIGGGWLTHRIDAGTLADLRLQHEREIAAENQRALEAVKTHAEATSREIGEMARLADERRLDIDSLRKGILNAPKSRACADSPAMRVLLDGLRGRADRDTGRTAPNAGSPAPVQAPTAGTR